MKVNDCYNKNVTSYKLTNYHVNNEKVYLIIFSNIKMVIFSKNAKLLFKIVRYIVTINHLYNSGVIVMWSFSHIPKSISDLVLRVCPDYENISYWMTFLENRLSKTTTRQIFAKRRHTTLKVFSKKGPKCRSPLDYVMNIKQHNNIPDYCQSV